MAFSHVELRNIEFSQATRRVEIGDANVVKHAHGERNEVSVLST